jgi:hypothetical protein
METEGEDFKMRTQDGMIRAEIQRGNPRIVPHVARNGPARINALQNVALIQLQALKKRTRIGQKKHVAFAHHNSRCRVVWLERQRVLCCLTGEMRHEEAHDFNDRSDCRRAVGWLQPQLAALVVLPR